MSSREIIADQDAEEEERRKRDAMRDAAARLDAQPEDFAAGLTVEQCDKPGEFGIVLKRVGQRMRIDFSQSGGNAGSWWSYTELTIVDLAPGQHTVSTQASTGTGIGSSSSSSSSSTSNSTNSDSAPPSSSTTIAGSTPIPAKEVFADLQANHPEVLCASNPHPLIRALKNTKYGFDTEGGPRSKITDVVLQAAMAIWKDLVEVDGRRALTIEGLRIIMASRSTAPPQPEPELPEAPSRRRLSDPDDKPRSPSTSEERKAEKAAEEAAQKKTASDKAAREREHAREIVLEERQARQRRKYKRLKEEEERKIAIECEAAIEASIQTATAAHNRDRTCLRANCSCRRSLFRGYQ